MSGPLILVSLALSDDRPELNDVFLVTSIEKPGINSIRFDVPVAQCIELFQNRTALERRQHRCIHRHGLQPVTIFPGYQHLATSVSGNPLIPVTWPKQVWCVAITSLSLPKK